MTYHALLSALALLASHSTEANDSGTGPQTSCTAEAMANVAEFTRVDDAVRARASFANDDARGRRRFLAALERGLRPAARGHSVASRIPIDSTAKSFSQAFCGGRPAGLITKDSDDETFDADGHGPLQSLYCQTGGAGEDTTLFVGRPEPGAIKLCRFDKPSVPGPRAGLELGTLHCSILHLPTGRIADEIEFAIYDDARKGQSTPPEQQGVYTPSHVITALRASDWVTRTCPNLALNDSAVEHAIQLKTVIDRAETSRPIEFCDAERKHPAVNGRCGLAGDDGRKNAD